MWSKYWSFSISPSNEYLGLISFRIDWFDLAVQGTLRSLLQHHIKTCVLVCLVAQLCLILCDTVECGLHTSGSSVHGDSLGKNTGVGCHALLQGILLTQGSNPGLLHFSQILYHLSHQEFQTS